MPFIKHQILRLVAWALYQGYVVAAWFARERIFPVRSNDPRYQLYLLKHNCIFPQPGLSCADKPVFSILTPAYNTDETELTDLARSVLRQTLGSWEWIVIDDASSDSTRRAALAALETLDPRIKVQRNDRNLGIAASTNKAAEQAVGEFLLLLDHDDLLYPHALDVLCAGWQRHPEAAALYADEDRLLPNGKRGHYGFKPAFSPSLLEMRNYILHPLCIRRQSWRALDGMRAECDGSQDYDLLLRLWDAGAEIRHVPGVLYSWRESATSMVGGTFKPYVFDAGKRALYQHLLRRQECFEAVEDHPCLERGDYRIRWHMPAAPRVLLISRFFPAMPSDWKITRLNPGTNPLATALSVQVEQFAAVIFLAAEFATSPDDMAELLAWSIRPDVGVAGACVLTADQRIVHAGLSLSAERKLQTDFVGLPQNQVIESQRPRDCLALDGAIAVAGTRLTLLAQNVLPQCWSLTLCLNARTHGWRVVYTPFAQFRTLSDWQVTFDDATVQNLLNKYGVERDPYLNPNLEMYPRYGLRLPLNWPCWPARAIQHV